MPLWRQPGVTAPSERSGWLVRRDRAMAHGVAGRALDRAPAIGRRGAPAWVSADGEHAGWGRRRVAADVSAARLAARDAVRVLRAFRAGTRCRAEVSRRARDIAAAHQIAEAPDLVGVPFGEP